MDGITAPIIPVLVAIELATLQTVDWTTEPITAVEEVSAEVTVNWVVGVTDTVHWELGVTEAVIWLLGVVTTLVASVTGSGAAVLASVAVPSAPQVSLVR